LPKAQKPHFAARKDFVRGPAAAVASEADANALVTAVYTPKLSRLIDAVIAEEAILDPRVEPRDGRGHVSAEKSWATA
jgi:hypothetical protein